MGDSLKGMVENHKANKCSIELATKFVSVLQPLLRKFIYDPGITKCKVSIVIF